MPRQLRQIPCMLSEDPRARSRHDPESGETRPTNDEPVCAPIGGTGDLADYFAPASQPQFSNPTVRSAPDFSRSPRGFITDHAGRVSNDSPLDISQLQTLFPWTVSPRAAPTRAPLEPFSITIWGANTRPAIVIYWQGRLPESWLSAAEPAVPTQGPHHCPRHQTIRGSWYF